MRNRLLLCAIIAVAHCQTFEVASIKLSTPASERGSNGGAGGVHYSFHRGSVLDFIAIGFDIEYRQVASKTDLDKVDFDLDAKLPPNTTREQLHAMLRNLLAERFHLKHHIETREFTGYELIVAKSGPKLLPEGMAPEHQEGFPDLSMNRRDLRSVHRRMDDGYILVRMRGRLLTMADLADSLQPPDDGPIADKTGLTGKFDFALEYSQELSATQSPTVPDLFAALQQQLGLQLVRKKIPLQVVVVDSIDKFPTEN